MTHIVHVFVQVDQWLDFSDAIVSGAGLEAVCGIVDQFLSLRTYLVGYQLSIADLQVWGQLQGRHNPVMPAALLVCLNWLTRMHAKSSPGTLCCHPCLGQECHFIVFNSLRQCSWPYTHCVVAAKYVIWVLPSLVHQVHQ